MNRLMRILKSPVTAAAAKGGAKSLLVSVPAIAAAILLVRYSDGCVLGVSTRVLSIWAVAVAATFQFVVLFAVEYLRRSPVTARVCDPVSGACLVFAGLLAWLSFFDVNALLGSLLAAVAMVSFVNTSTFLNFLVFSEQRDRHKSEIFTAGFAVFFLFYTIISIAVLGATFYYIPDLILWLFD